MVCTIDSCHIVQWLVDRDESVTWVNEAGVDDASRAVIPVWAVKTFVANTIDVLSGCQLKYDIEKSRFAYLVATIADGIVANVTARSKKSLCQKIKVGVLNSRHKRMLGVVTVLHTNVARNAKIIIVACSAGNEVLFGEFWESVRFRSPDVARLKFTLNTRVAGTCSCEVIVLSNQGDLGLRESSWGLWLRCDGLSCAIDDLAVLDKALDHPVTLAIADNAIANTGLAKIKVSLITGAAMVMLIRNGSIAVVTVDREDAGCWGRHTTVVSKRLLTVMANISKLGKPGITSSCAPVGGDLAARAHTALGRGLLVWTAGA